MGGLESGGGSRETETIGKEGNKYECKGWSVLEEIYTVIILTKMISYQYYHFFFNDVWAHALNKQVLWLKRLFQSAIKHKAATDDFNVNKGGKKQCKFVDPIY